MNLPWLIRVRDRANGHEAPRADGPSETPRGLLLRVALHVDDAVEVLGSGDAQVLVAVRRIAIPASHRAAPIGVRGPGKGDVRRGAPIEERSGLEVEVADAVPLLHHLVAEKRGKVRGGNTGADHTFALSSPFGWRDARAVWKRRRASFPT